MRTEPKLAHSSGILQSASIGDMLQSMKRAISHKHDRKPERPLKDLDGWSDQAEVAFYEDCRNCRA